MKRMAIYLLITAFVVVCLTGIAQEVKTMTIDTSFEKIYQVTTPKGQLNVRSKPEAHSAVVGKLSNRSYVKVLKQENGFFQVELKDAQSGWVAVEFLSPTDYGAEVLDYRALQIGSKGKDVEALKKRLLDLGYYRKGHAMSDSFNANCVIRVKLFQKINGLEENGIATPMMQALLFSPEAKGNNGEIPAVKRTFLVGPHSNLLQQDGFDWNKFAKENPGVCMCCLGKGCECCNFTGRID
jgi:murein L,D-transpeptidase YcbB/YkuD